MSKFKELHDQLRQITQACVPLIGHDATRFLCDTVGMQSMCDEMRHAWKGYYSGRTPDMVLEMMEDKWMMYLTHMQMHALRRILDQHLIINENRIKAKPFVLMAMCGMSHSAAVDELNKLAWPNELLDILLVEVQPKGSVQ